MSDSRNNLQWQVDLSPIREQAGDEVLLFKISTKEGRKQLDVKTTARKHSTSTQLAVEQSKLTVG